MTDRVIRPCGLLIRDQRLLVMRYDYGGHDRYNLPGGNLEPNEEIHQCLIREFHEELNVTVIPEHLLFVAETQTDKATLHLVFVVTSQDDPQLNPQSVKARELLWLPPDTLDLAPCYPAIGFALGPWMRGTALSPVFLGHISQPWFY